MQTVQPRAESAYVVLASTFAVVLVLSNIIAVKLIRVPGSELALPVGVLTYPLTFLISDLVAELWGEVHARRMVYLAFGMSLLMLAVIWLAVQLPPHPSWGSLGEQYGLSSIEEQQNAFASVFSLNGLLVAASLCAYLVAQLLDVRLYGAIRNWTAGRHLWLRNNVSTLLSQLVDTSIVTGIYLFIGLGVDFKAGLSIMLTAYAYKAFFALCDTPLLYAATYLLRRYLSQCRVGPMAPTLQSSQASL